MQNNPAILMTDPAPLYPFPSLDGVLKPGESGPVMYILQAVLQELCAEVVSPVAPTVTGQYDQATAACAAAWQSITGYPPTGEVDRAFWDMLATMYNARLI